MIGKAGVGGTIITTLEPVVAAVTGAEKVITIFALIETSVALATIENIAVGGAAWAGETAPTTVSITTASDAPTKRESPFFQSNPNIAYPQLVIGHLLKKKMYSIAS